jgi:predicted enzyme related to lactoylglutathione lyase
MEKVVHFEIPADNLNRANRFYSAVFGWKITPAPKMEDQYHMAYTVEVDKKMMPKEPGAINGALMTREGQGSKYPVLVIDVPSLDAYLKKIQKAGGKVVMPKQKVMDMGWYARVTDTEGNVIGIWENIKK